MGILANFEPLLLYYCVTILNFKTVFLKKFVLRLFSWFIKNGFGRKQPCSAACEAYEWRKIKETKGPKQQRKANSDPQNKKTSSVSRMVVLFVALVTSSICLSADNLDMHLVGLGEIYPHNGRVWISTAFWHSKLRNNVRYQFCCINGDKMAHHTYIKIPFLSFAQN